MNGVTRDINTSSKGYNPNSFDFGGNPILFLIVYFGTKPLYRSCLLVWHTHSTFAHDLYPM